MDRRGFLKLAGTVTGGAMTSRLGSAQAATPSADGWSVLVDLTRCVGCRMCEAACAEANGLPEPDWSDDYSYASHRPTTATQWTAVNRYETSRGELFVKRQCMHCLHPACAAACLTKALEKQREGPVVWTEDRCMGCRYCMVSCPFDVPRFEYDSPVPKVAKCRMCFEKLLEEGDGAQPACVEGCPNEVMSFGPREEMLELARRRIYADPDAYIHRIYGEHEAGGTGWLYISPVPFEELGFRTDLGTESYPEKTRDFLTAVPLVLLMWPVGMLALRRALERNDETGPTARRRWSDDEPHS